MDKYNFDFALSIPPMTEGTTQCLKALENSPFRTLEIPGTWLESQGLRKEILNSDFFISGVNDLIAASVAASIPDQKKNIINGFIEKLLILFEEMEDCNIKRFSLNTGFEGTINDQIRIDARVSLLKKIAPFLYRKNMKLTIPVRVPSITSVPKGRYGRLLKDTMSGDIRITLNIHPHETVSKVNPEDIVREFRFYLETVAFVYEPETGNTLVENLISPWLKELSEINYQGSVVFLPRVSSIDSLMTSVNNLSQLLKLN